MKRNERHEHAVSAWLHSHDFGGANRDGERRTAWVMGLTIATMAVEIAAGWLTGSMALLADGWHMGTHAAALGAAWGSFVFTRRHAHDPRFTFGTGKVGALTAFGSAILLALVAILMFWESGRRLLAPESIRIGEALLVAVIGLTVNLVSAWLLQAPHHAHAHHDHNLRAAYVHVLADALTSVLAIGALLAARQWGWAWADPLMGIVGGAIILRWAWTLGRETARILVDGDVAPGEMESIRHAIESDGDSRVTDLHVWRVGPADKAVIVSIVTGQSRLPAHYRSILGPFTDLKHISIEVNQCAVCTGPGQMARGNGPSSPPSGKSAALKLLAFALLSLAGGFAPAADAPFGIRVVDEQSDRGVPLVELRTVHEVRYVTDSAGWAAIDAPELMGQRVYFAVRAHGYEYPKDGFGYAGKALVVVPGGRAELRIKRLLAAERIYRITGAGVYADSVRLGQPAPLREPLLNAQVVGQDSALAAVYRGRVFWVWGDTQRAGYPLGNFAATAAWSDLPGRGGLAADVGIDLQYLAASNGFVRAACPLEGPGMVWLDGLLAVRDPASGAECLLAHYARMKSLGERLEHGIARFDDARGQFVKVRELEPANRWRHPAGHPERVADGGAEWFVFPRPLATVRVRVDLAAVLDPAAYEAFTCLPAGAQWREADAPVERDAAGAVVYGWKRDTDPVDQTREGTLIARGLLRPDEARYRLCAAGSGEPVTIHAASIRWNAYRKAWILIGEQHTGKTSLLGEIWYAEAPEPTGPWRKAVKIVTHDRYSFYNPVQHAFLDAEGGRVIYFEGTYTATFSGVTDLTPRYEYNQVMYRLDLADSRFAAAR